MTIRPMRREDLPACARILQSVYNNVLWQGRWNEETALAYLTDFYEIKKFVGFVLEDDAIIGALFGREKVWWNNSEVFVEEMFISPQYQHKGYGTLLMRHLEAYIRERDLAGITLTTNRYAPAPDFYRKNGFVDCSHVLCMAKEL